MTGRKTSIVSHERKSLETFDVVCSGCGKSYPLKDVEVFHDCTEEDVEGKTKTWKKFYLVTKTQSMCPHCEKQGDYIELVA